MSVIGFIIGILSFINMGIGLIPFLGWLNWFNIPFAAIGLILSALGYSRYHNGLGIGGIILCSIAIGVGILRLILGGGFL